MDRGRSSAPGELRVEGRAGKLQLRGGVTWSLAPAAELNSLNVNGHFDLRRDLRLSLGLTRQLGGDSTSASAGVDWALAPLRLRLDASGATDGGLRLGASVGFGLGRDRRLKTSIAMSPTGHGLRCKGEGRETEPVWQRRFNKLQPEGECTWKIQESTQ